LFIGFEKQQGSLIFRKSRSDLISGHRERMLIYLEITRSLSPNAFPGYPSPATRYP